MDVPHEVVRLLLARMESHPEEFKSTQSPYHNRWYDQINAISAYGNDTDKAAINARVRDIRLGEVHEQVMDELLNGPTKRRMEDQEAEYERHLVRQNKTKKGFKS